VKSKIASLQSFDEDFNKITGPVMPRRDTLSKLAMKMKPWDFCFQIFANYVVWLVLPAEYCRIKSILFCAWFNEKI